MLFDGLKREKKEEKWEGGSEGERDDVPCGFSVVICFFDTLLLPLFLVCSILIPRRFYFSPAWLFDFFFFLVCSLVSY